MDLIDTTFPSGRNDALQWNIKSQMAGKIPVEIRYFTRYFLFTIDGREDIKDKEPKRLVSMKVADVPLECIYKLTDRDGGKHFTKFYRFKNEKLLDDDGEKKREPL